MMKKLMTLLVAVLMVLTMASKTMAEEETTSYTITVSNALKGESYDAYKIFDATYNGDAVSYTIKSTSEWFSVVANGTPDTMTGVITANGLKFTPSATDNTLYVITPATSTELTEENFAKAFAATLYTALKAQGANYSKAASATATADGSLTLDVTTKGPGYYFVNTSLGSLCALNTAKPTATVTEKNTAPTVEKTADDDFYQIGDTVTFTITVTVGKQHDKNIVLADTMDSALSFIEIVSVKKGENNFPYTATNGKFPITLAAANLSGLESGDTIVIKYTAKMTKAAKAGTAMNNKVTLTYSAQTSEDDVDVNTNKFAVKKYATNVTNLAGATFKLYKVEGETKTLVKLVGSGTSYRVAEADETGAVDSFTTVDSGNIVIDGVDSDCSYELEETEAPEGYNLLDAKKSVTVGSDNNTVVEIENQAGTVLPSTGGIGTTIFHVAGALLVLGAGIVLISKKRANNN